MPFDKDFLSPRGLLVNNNKSFVCSGPNFFKLQEATQATLDLPYNDAGMRWRVGLSERGMQELYADILVPAMGHFYKVTNQSMALESGYRSIGDVCTKILELSATAPADYDDIFDALERLYGEESGNDELRRQVQAKMQERIDKLKALADFSTGVTDRLRDAIDNVGDAQADLKIIGNNLGNPNIIERLRQRHQGNSDPGEFDNDVRAVGTLRNIISGQNMKDESGPSMENLQRAVGAAVNIWTDLTDLAEFVAEHTEPGPGPIMDIQKNKLLEMWADLATEVQKFKDDYIGKKA